MLQHQDRESLKKAIINFRVKNLNKKNWKSLATLFCKAKHDQLFMTI